MRALAATVVAMLAAAPALAAGSGDARLDAFDAACLDGHRDPEARVAAIARAGWAAAADDAHPELAALMALTRRAMDGAREEGFGTALAVYGSRVGGLDLFLVTDEMDQPADNVDFRIDLMGCYLFDFEATAPVDPVLVAARFDERPAQTVDEPGEIVAQTWNVEAIEGVWDVQATFIPEGSPNVARTGFSGASLKITSTKAK